MTSLPSARRDATAPAAAGASTPSGPFGQLGAMGQGQQAPVGGSGRGTLVTRAGSAVAGVHPVAATLVLQLAAFVALAAVTVAVGLVLGSSALGSVDRWDLSVDRWFEKERTSSVDSASAFGSALANTPTVVAVAAVVVVGLWIARRWKGAVLLVVALVLEVSVFLTTTLIVDRERPEVQLIVSAVGIVVHEHRHDHHEPEPA